MFRTFDMARQSSFSNSSKSLMKLVFATYLVVIWGGLAYFLVLALRHG